MKIAVIGGAGRIGSRIVNRLHGHGHHVAAASPTTGVDTITREGLDEALAGIDVVVDVTDSPITEEAPATWFFSTSTSHLLAAEKAAGVRYHLVLSVLGADRMTSGYFMAKLAQERRVKESGIPHTILRTTTCFETIEAIVDKATVGSEVRLAHVRVQPVAADDVAAAIAHLAFSPPANGTLEIAGPDQFPLDELARQLLETLGDDMKVIVDAGAP